MDGCLISESRHIFALMFVKALKAMVFFFCSDTSFIAFTFQT